MQETASANASIRTPAAISARAPVDDAIVAAPNMTGIAAARGERKTSSSASSSSGSAMSSARWIVPSDERVPSRASSGRPVTVAWTGAAVALPTRRCAATLRSAIWSWVPLTDSSTSARSLEGRSAERPADVDHGLITRTPGRLESRVTSALPCRLTSARGPRSRTGIVAESPKLPPISARAREDSEPEICRLLADRRLSMPRPTTPSTTAIEIQAVSTAHGYDTAKRVSAGVGLSPPPDSGCMCKPP